MKTIGIVGGLAWPSTVIYYRTINELVAARLGGLHCAQLVLAQTDFDQVERYQRAGRWDLVGDLLAAQARNLKAVGADFFLQACNTVHTASERIETLAGLPFLHIVDPTARQIRQAGFTTAGLLGSRYTMTGTYCAGGCAAATDWTSWSPRASTRTTCTTPCTPSWPTAPSCRRPAPGSGQRSPTLGRDHPLVLTQRPRSLQPPPGRSHRREPECALT